MIYPVGKRFQTLLDKFPLFSHAASCWGHFARTALREDAQGDSQNSETTKRLVMDFLAHDEKRVQAAVQGLFLTKKTPGMFWPKSWSATHLATFFGLNRIVDSLLEAELQRGANLAEERMYHYQALVAIASARGHASTLRMLLDLHCPREGSFLEAQVILPGLDETRATPLCLAAKNGHTGVSALLLKRGAAPDTPDDSGRTPLSLAAANGHVKVGALLIDHGAKLDGQDVSGRTPLIWAAEEVHEDVVKLLLEAGCKPQIKDDKGMSALSYAAKNGHRGIVEALIKCGAPLEDRDVWGRRPSEQARHSGHLAIAGILEAAEKERVE